VTDEGLVVASRPEVERPGRPQDPNRVPREDGPTGRLRRLTDPTTVLIVFLCVAVFANYLSSWLPETAGYPTGAVLRDLLAAAFITVAARCLWQARPAERGRTTILTPVEEKIVAVVFLVLLPLIGAFFLADDRHGAALVAAKDLVLYVAAGTAAYLLFRRGLLSRRAVGLAILVIGLIVSVLGILDTVTSARSLGWLGYDPNFAGVPNLMIVGEAPDYFGQDRASGGLTNAVSLGYLTAVLACFAAYRLLHERTGKGQAERILELAVVIAGSVACVLTLTRGAILALGIAMVILAVNASRVRDAAALLALVVLIALGVVWGSELHIGNTAQIVQRRVGNTDAVTQASTAARRDELRYAFDTLPSDPLGTGISSAGKAASRFGEDANKRIVQHSAFLALAFQIGLPGLALVLVAFATLAWGSLRTARRGGNCALAVLFLYFVNGALGTGLADPVFAVPFLVVLALALTVTLRGQIALTRP
jgi:O-Antigen ligase